MVVVPTTDSMYHRVRRFLEALDEASEGADTDEQLDAQVAAIAEAEQDIEAKADMMAAAIDTLTARAKARRQRAAEIVDAARIDENAAKRIRAALLDAMVATGKTKIQTVDHKYSTRKTAAPVEIVDEGSIPGDYWIEQAPKLDKRGIANALKTGKVPGARLGEQGLSLVIK